MNETTRRNTKNTLLVLKFVKPNSSLWSINNVLIKAARTKINNVDDKIINSM